MRAAVTLAVAAAALAPRIARAEPHVVVEAACGLEDPAGVQRVVRVELGTSGATAHATVRCDGGVIHLRVDDSRRGRVVERELSLADVPDGARARTLGLAVVELVTAILDEPAAIAPPAPAAAFPATAAPPFAAPAIVAERPFAPATVTLDAAVAERHHSGDLVLRGAAVAGSYTRGWLEVGLAGEWLGGGDVDVVDGHVQIQAWTLGAQLRARLAYDRLALAAGVGIHAGRARLRGLFLTGDAPIAWRSIADVRGVVTARAHATRRWSLQLSLELGHVLDGIDHAADTDAQTLYGGRFVGVTAGVGAAF
jgi:hypothetical protein